MVEEIEGNEIIGLEERRRMKGIEKEKVIKGEKEKTNREKLDIFTARKDRQR